MKIHRLPATRGVAWLREAANIGARNPRAVFGAAALFAATLYTLAVAAVLPVAISLQGREALTLGQALGTVVPLFLVMTFMLPILLGGLMHVLREAEAGRPVRARDLFAPVREGRAGPLAALGLVQIAFNAVGGLLVVGLAGSDYWPEYFKAVQGALSGHVPVAPQPDHPLLMTLVQLVFNYFSYALMLLCVPLLTFSRIPFLEGLRMGLHASVANLGANLLAGMLFMLGLLLAAIVVGMIALMVGLVGSLLHPLLGAVLSLMVYGLFAVAVLVVLVAISYVAWRDTFGAPVEPAAPAAHFEA